MKLKRFEALLDQQGADLTGWPPDDAAAARALLAISPEARRQFALAEGVEAALHATGSRGASPELLQRVLATAYGAPQLAPQQRRGPGGWVRGWTAGASAEWRGWVAGLATATAAMVLGFVLGVSGAVPFQTRGGDQIALLAGSAGEPDEGAEMAAVMLGDRSGEFEQ